MYIPDYVFQTISQDIHAERIANAQRRRFASTRVDEDAPRGLSSTAACPTLVLRVADCVFRASHSLMRRLPVQNDFGPACYSRRPAPTLQLGRRLTQPTPADLKRVGP